MSKFRIAIVTGTRAEFGIWRPVLDAISASAGLESLLLVTGMHLLPEFGNTGKQIEQDGHAIAARIPMYRQREPAHKSLARAVEQFGAAFARLKPGLVFLLGDRLEMLAAANAALAGRIPIAHLHGGESARGIWDEQIRHAISKMAHVHFCATGRARWRLLHMGESPASVHQVGAPALDIAEAHARLCRPIAAKIRRYRQTRKRGHEALLILHPEGGADADENRKAQMAIQALQKSGLAFDVIGPNNDPGHAGILAAYADAALPVTMSVPQGTFWTKLACVSFLMGNSSSGIIESASFGVPAINLGTRQSGRDRNPNTLDAPWQPAAIAGAIDKALHDGSFLRRVARRENVYGNGRAATQIVTILERLSRKQISLEKQFWD
ncbi:MAG TPA: UDP-N-acetylglucosamine 2-epimerase [Phycisphaerae bacterium]|nr:UDP-N-acetylglucosamine 2-epimerase [Phycisphaerae bacterium]